MGRAQRAEEGRKVCSFKSVLLNGEQVLGGVSAGPKLGVVSMEPSPGTNLQAFLRYSPLQSTALSFFLRLICKI